MLIYLAELTKQIKFEYLNIKPYLSFFKERGQNLKMSSAAILGAMIYGLLLDKSYTKHCNVL